MLYVFIWFMVMPLIEGQTPYRTIILSDLVGETMRGGTLSEVSVPRTTSGIDYLLVEFYNHEPGTQTIWASEGQETIEVWERFTSTCKYTTYLTLNVSPGGQLEAYVNGLHQISATHSSGNDYDYNSLIEQTYCRVNEVRFYITVPSGTTPWFWYHIEMEES
jgi:hypothetical protein